MAVNLLSMFNRVFGKDKDFDLVKIYCSLTIQCKNLKAFKILLFVIINKTTTVGKVLKQKKPCSSCQ